MPGFRKIHTLDSSGESWINGLGTCDDTGEGFPFYFGREDPRPIFPGSSGIGWHEYKISLGTQYSSIIYMKLFENPENSLYIKIFKYDDISTPIYESIGAPNEEFTTTLPDSLYRMRIIKEKGTPSLPDGSSNYDIALYAHPQPTSNPAGTTNSTALSIGDITNGPVFNHVDDLYVLIQRDSNYNQTAYFQIDRPTNVYAFTTTKVGNLHLEFEHLAGLQVLLEGGSLNTTLDVNGASTVRIIPGHYFITVRRPPNTVISEFFRRYSITVDFRPDASEGL